jgi:hypothetical protein
MPRKSKRAHRLAALKGWRTRRANIQKRSDAAKKGWLKRRQSKPGPPPEEPIVISRLQYQTKRGRTYDLEIQRRGKKILSVKVGKHTYRGKEDINSFLPLIASAS